MLFHSDVQISISIRHSFSGLPYGERMSEWEREHEHLQASWGWHTAHIYTGDQKQFAKQGLSTFGTLPNVCIGDVYCSCWNFLDIWFLQFFKVIYRVNKMFLFNSFLVVMKNLVLFYCTVLFYWKLIQFIRKA